MIMPETSGPDVTDKNNSKLWKTKLNNIVLGGGPENSLQVLYYWWWWKRGGEDCGGCLLPQLDHSLLQCSIAEERNAWQHSHIINITTIFMTFYITIIVWFNQPGRYDIIISRYLKFCRKLEKSLSAVVLSTSSGWMLLLHSGKKQHQWSLLWLFSLLPSSPPPPASSPPTASSPSPSSSSEVVLSYPYTVVSKAASTR